MATTENIGLTLFEGSDYVSREAINENFTKIAEALGIDYICERGKSGDWEWVKYNSGFMEQWVVDKAFPSIDVRAWVGNEGILGRTNNMTFGNFPIPFTTLPQVYVTFNSTESGAFESLIGYDGNNSTTKAQNFFLVDPCIGATVGTPHFGIYARGYYK